jgi:hypothetical protein
MSDLFNIYEDSLNSTFNKITTIINTMQNLSKEKTESAINEANSHLQEAQSLIKKLELEVSAYSSNEKGAMKVKNYKNEYENLRRRFTEQQDKYIKSKSDEALYLNSLNEDEHNNKKLVENEEAAFSQSSKLDRAKSAVYDIEIKGNDAMRQLHHQTKIMNNINKNLDQENDVLQDSNSLMAQMLKRENRNKLIIIISICIVAFICLLVFLLN